MKEEWKKVKGFEYYEISNLGRVKSIERSRIGRYENICIVKEKILKQSNNNGYYHLTLCFNSKKYTKKIHVLVAENFLNHNKSNGLIIDHINNNSLDNRLENLQLITLRKNLSKDKKGLSKYTGVSFRKDRNKWRAVIYYNNKNNYLGLFKTELEASEAYNNRLIYINENGIN